MNTRIICLSLQQNHISQTTAGEPCTFTEGVRYSQLVINSRINDFKANQSDAGFGVFDSQGNLIAEPNYSMKNLDYVPGLVAKAIIEKVYYYKDNSMVDVRPGTHRKYRDFPTIE